MLILNKTSAVCGLTDAVECETDGGKLHLMRIVLNAYIAHYCDACNSKFGLAIKSAFFLVDRNAYHILLFISRANMI